MRKILFTLFIVCLLPVAVSASTGTPEDAYIKGVENYLNGIRTMQAKFVQTANDGSRLTGTFYLKRPGKLRFEYDDIDDFIVADGLFIYFYDGGLKEQTHTLIRESLADFFLRKNLSLSGDITVRDTDGNGNMTLINTDEPESGELVLSLGGDSGPLKGWKIVDGQGYVTTIELSNVQDGVKLDNDFFHYVDPEQTSPALNE